MSEKKYQIITFYEFKKLSDLEGIKLSLKSAMSENNVFGTFIVAEEGFNSTISATSEDIEKIVPIIEGILETRLNYKTSFHHEIAFKRQKVKIKKEIVTLRKKVDVEKGLGTHVKSVNWNEILNDPETVILDTRNNYEYQIGTFKGAINPETNSFNELPEYIEKNLDPKKHKKIAMFCTGGIRCEKFAPYMKEKVLKRFINLKAAFCGIWKMFQMTRVCGKVNYLFLMTELQLTKT